MSVKITIIGLGQIGASIGLALATHKDMVYRVGHDKEPAVAKRAKELQAIDRTEYNLHNSVYEADAVLLTLPMSEIQETLTQIAPDLKPGAVVMDTAPVKAVVAQWASELLPADRHYIGLTPVINPQYLHELDSGIEKAHADLFNQGIIAIASSPSTKSEAIKLAADLARAIGAAPLFADPTELDGLMASTYILPMLVSAALVNSTFAQPGWREARKVAGRAYAEATSPMTLISQAESLASAALLNRENVSRVIDGIIASLQAIRKDLQSEDQVMLEERLARARNGRINWWMERQSSNWLNEETDTTGEMPKSSDIFANLLGIRRKPKNQAKP